MNQKLRQALSAELQPGEEILWEGRPSPCRMARNRLGTSLFGIFWTAFALFWTGGAAGLVGTCRAAGSCRWFALFGIPFAMIGLGMIFSPVFAALRARRIVYAVTDRRILVIQTGCCKIAWTYAPADLGPLVRVDGCGGRGDLLFSAETSSCRGPSGGFLGIDDARAVEKLILNQFKKNNQA